ARAAVAGCAEIRAGLQRALRQFARFRIAGIERKLRHVRRDVHDEPVPESAARGRIRIVAGDREALGARGRARPGKVRRPVAARATEAEICRKDVIHREIIAILEAVASHLEEREEKYSSTPNETVLLRYYANSIAHHLSTPPCTAS